MNRDLLTYIGQQPRLPEGYREVEYLESTGAQWIDTGVYVNQDTDVEIDYCNVEYSNKYSVFGCNPMIAFTVLTANTDVRFRYNSQQYENSVPQTTRAVRRMNGNIVSVNGETVYMFQSATFQSNYTAALFARRINSSGGIEEKAKSKVWSCRIDNIRYFVPCVRTADSKPGLYDLCGSICPLTGTPFYVNSGTGADFLWGEKKPDFFPTYGMVFWNPLDKWRTRAATGQTMTYNGTADSPVLPTSAIYKNIPCCLFGPGSYWYAPAYVKDDKQAYVGTLSCWVASATPLVKWDGTNGIVAVSTSPKRYTRYGVEWQNNQLNLSAGKHDNATTYNTYTDIPNDTGWRHYVVMLECEAGWTNTKWTDTVYVDGVKVRSETNNYVNYELTALCLGQYRSTDSYGFYIAGVRLYNRLLHPDEILALAHEYTPTE